MNNEATLEFLDMVMHDELDCVKSAFEHANRMFLTYTPNFLGTDDEGNTALHLAAHFGYLSMLEFLKASGRYDMQARNIHGHTPLLLAASMQWTVWHG